MLKIRKIASFVLVIVIVAGCSLGENVVSAYAATNKTQMQRFADSLTKEQLYQDTNPFLELNGDVMPLGYEYNELIAQEWADALLEDLNYGKGIGYSSGWYNSLSTVELLARTIYGENNKIYREQVGVAWVIMNRSKNYGSLRSVIIARGQFSSITGTEKNTQYARNPVTNHNASNGVAWIPWERATFLACLMLTTMDEEEWEIIAGRPIGAQKYFYSYTAAKNNGNVFRDYNGKIQYNDGGVWKNIKDVVVIDYGIQTSAAAMLSLDIQPWTKNIFYSYEEE